FFLQAVSGILYFPMTGVQTCALPISGYARTDDLNGYRQEGFGPMDRTVTPAGLVQIAPRGAGAAAAPPVCPICAAAATVPNRPIDRKSLRERKSGESHRPRQIKE